MQYTEEHYAQMYNGLPEGLKDLVLSGRLAILVSGIGSRHGLTADQIADLEPAIEDVCLGLITKKELVENIRKSTDVDQRVANRIAAEADLEILRPFDAELAIARKQKEDLDQSIGKVEAQKVEEQVHPVGKKIPEPQNVSGHATAKKVSDWYNKESDAPVKNIPTNSNFDWEKDFGKSKEEAAKTETTTAPDANIETKLEKLTESINMLVSNRFGGGEKDTSISTQMQELLKRLEKAEKENEENKKMIKNLSGTKPVDNIFGTTQAPETKIQIDKQRKVEIARSEPKEKKEVSNGNIQITSVSKSVPIEHKGADISELISSTVSKDTLDSIVETRNKPEPIASTQAEGKKGLSLEELISGGDKKIKGSAPQKTATLVFPGRDEEKKIDIKNLSQKESLKQTLLEDLDFLKSTPTETVPATPEPDPKLAVSEAVNNQNKADTTPDTPKAQGQSTYPSNPFKDELMPTTKEDRMKALQAKIKSLNTGASVGGKSNIGASTLDPYRL